MISIDREKLLQDYNDLLAKQELGLAEVETAARAFAVQRGYDVEKTAAFIEYVKDNESDGLSNDERIKLNILSAYISVVSDQPEVPEAPVDAVSENGEVVD